LVDRLEERELESTVQVIPKYLVVNCRPGQRGVKAAKVPVVVCIENISGFDRSHLIVSYFNIILPIRNDVRNMLVVII